MIDSRLAQLRKYPALTTFL